MWLQEDRDAEMEYEEYLSSLCSGCGQPKVECMDPDSAYDAVPIQCFACAAKDAEGRTASEAKAEGSYGAAAFDGIYFAVQKRN